MSINLKRHGRHSTPHHTGDLSSAAPICSADFWCVRFETLEGSYHPIWYGVKGGPMIERHDVEAWAQTYYVNNRQWLKRIDDIYPPNNDSATPVA